MRHTEKAVLAVVAVLALLALLAVLAVLAVIAALATRMLARHGGDLCGTITATSRQASCDRYPRHASSSTGPSPRWPARPCLGRLLADGQLDLVEAEARDLADARLGQPGIEEECAGPQAVCLGQVLRAHDGRRGTKESEGGRERGGGVNVGERSRSKTECKMARKETRQEKRGLKRQARGGSR